MEILFVWRLIHPLLIAEGNYNVEEMNKNFLRSLSKVEELVKIRQKCRVSKKAIPPLGIHL